jgi:hypothetical protein
MDQPSESPVPQERAKILIQVLPWIALLSGAFFWWLDANPPGFVTAGRVIETLHMHVFAGIGAAFGVALSLWTMRKGTDFGVASIALLVNASLIVLEITRIAARL